LEVSDGLMKPWKKVSNLDLSSNSKSGNEKEVESNADIFSMLASLNKLNNGESFSSRKPLNMEYTDGAEKKETAVNFSDSLKIENTLVDKDKIDDVLDGGQENKGKKALGEDNKFLEKIYNLIKLKRETEKDSKRDTSPGYAINTEDKAQIPDSIIRTLITKFLNQRFLTQDSDLNSRSDSFNKSSGFYKWDNKNIAIHLKTNQVQQILTDKYGYDYEAGENKSIPLSFYFDLSGSMSKYTNLLSVMAIELLKKEVKVLIGFNQNVQYQIDNLEDGITVTEFSEILKDPSKYYEDNKDIKKKIQFKYINCNIDKYLFDKQAEKCVVFSDYDSLCEIIKLSGFSQVYYFCFEDEIETYRLSEYKGYFCQVVKVNDIVDGLIKMNEMSFEAIKYTSFSKKKVL